MRRSLKRVVFDVNAFPPEEALSRTNPPEGPQKTAQKAWDTTTCKATIEDLLLASAHDPTSAAQFPAVSTTESGAWLNASPVATLNNLLDDRALQTAVASRLGIPVNAPHVCVCGAHADPIGYHALSCKRYGGVLHHANLNFAVRNALRKAGIMSELKQLD